MYGQDRMTEDNFTSIYKSLPDEDLLYILDRQADYQEVAVEADKIEITNRQLTEGQLRKAKARLTEKKTAEALEDYQVENLRTKLRNFLSSVLETFLPTGNEKPSRQRQINVVIFFLVAIFLYHFYRYYSFIRFLVTDDDVKWESNILFYSIPFLIVPLSAILLWHRKKSGWILATVFFSYTATSAISFMLFQLIRFDEDVPVF